MLWLCSFDAVAPANMLIGVVGGRVKTVSWRMSRLPAMFDRSDGENGCATSASSIHTISNKGNYNNEDADDTTPAPVCKGWCNSHACRLCSNDLTLVISDCGQFP